MQIENCSASQPLEIRGVSKWYGKKVQAVREVSLRVEPGELMVLVGPSGCGKSTLLRMIAGLESVEGGTILLGDREIGRVPPKDRDIAMVFQNYALYPTMKVRENLAFPLKMRRMEKAEIHRRVEAVAQKLGLEELLDRRPGALSGGQRQRVALGRAMIRSPRLFLMDEPLSNLDAKLRVRMRQEIVALQRELGTTTVYVTHDQVEAMTMGTRIAVMKDGVLQQADTPRQLYDCPANLFVAQFIGSPPMNVASAQLREQNGSGCLELWGKVIPAAGRGDCPVWAGVRPEDIILGGEDGWPATVETVEHTGRETLVYLRMGDNTLVVAATAGDPEIQAGQRIGFSLLPEKLHLFRKDDEMRL